MRRGARNGQLKGEQLRGGRVGGCSRARDGGGGSTVLPGGAVGAVETPEGGDGGDGGLQVGGGLRGAGRLGGAEVGLQQPVDRRLPTHQPERLEQSVHAVGMGCVATWPG